MGKPYLSEVVDYKRDIEPYSFIQIYSGVGSGKNKFIEKLIAGYSAENEDGTKYTIEPKTVLLITSRRAKVQEILNDKTVKVGRYVLEWDNGGPVDDLDAYFKQRRELPDLDGFGKPIVHQRSIACTNAAIEKYLQYNYIPTDSSTHLWQRFDYIVLDEAHSVVADASYQSAAYYVHSLVNKAYRENMCGNSSCRVIVMTGTPSILSNFGLPQKSNALNLMDTCKSITPNTISFIDAKDAGKNMLERLEKGERVIYFANQISTILGIYAKLPQNIKDITALSFTQKERLDVKDPEQKKICDRMKETEKAIAKEQQLPKNIRLLLTTSKNKEGINIRNTDISALYAETHCDVDLIQMSGRVREGFETLYVITDAAVFGVGVSKLEYMFSKDEVLVDAFEPTEDGDTVKSMNLIEFINSYFKEICRSNNLDLSDPMGRKSTYSYKALSEFIDYIHTKFPYIIFDYFKDEFVMYKDRVYSIKYYRQQNKKFNDAMESKERLTALAKEWFNGINVVWGEEKQTQIDKYLIGNELVGVPYDKVQREQLRGRLEEILGRPVKQFGKTLQAYGYRERSCSKNPKAASYGMRFLEKMGQLKKNPL